MRDKTVLDGFTHLVDSVSSDQAQLSRGISMLRTRQEALERLLLGSRFGIVKCVLIQLLSPKLLARMLQAVHVEEIDRFNYQRRIAMERRPVVKAAPVQGIIKP